MGYYSDFKISLSDTKLIIPVAERLAVLSDYYFEVEQVEEIISLQDSKWYDNDDHLKTVSTEFPDLTIELERVGEENGDMEKKVYQNGSVKKLKAVISYEEIDE